MLCLLRARVIINYRDYSASDGYDLNGLLGEDEEKLFSGSNFLDDTFGMTEPTKNQEISLSSFSGAYI